MARTISTIYNLMITELQTLETLQSVVYENSSSTALTPYLRLLADISTTSKVAVWRLFFFIVAVAIWLHETYWDTYKAEIEAKAKYAVAGNIDWYANIVSLFQYGYELVYKDKVWQYETTDSSAQIIKRRSVTEGTDALIIKVATEDADGNPIKLTNEQYNALAGYLKKIKFAGTRIQLISDNPDDLKFVVYVYYDPLVSSVKDNVVAAISNYLKNLKFDGSIYFSKFFDAIQAVSGVDDVEVITFQMRTGDNDFADIGRVGLPYAGYVSIFGGTDFTNETDNADGSIEYTNSEGLMIKLIPNV